MAEPLIDMLPQPKQVDMSGNVIVDEAVAELFPKGARVVAAHPHGASFWTKTARIDVELEDGSTRSYFLKASPNDLGKAMALSEFDGTAAVHKYVPEFVPQPVGWGQYKSDPNFYFYMCEFVDMIDVLPEVSSFCKILAELHKKSMSGSNGKFGYHITTYGGTMPQYVKWSDTWEQFYIENLKDFARQERETHGPSDELDAMFPALFEKVCPRLLRPLERGPNKIKPVLVHGDIWYGNVSTNADTGEAITFDPSVLWAHNEYELSVMTVTRYRLGRQWLKEYHRHFPICDPEEDYEDRLKLYAIHNHFCAGALRPNTREMRQNAIDDIRCLVEKYPNGYEG